MAVISLVSDAIWDGILRSLGQRDLSVGVVDDHDDHDELRMQSE